MTVIVGLVEGGVVYMAGDRASVIVDSYELSRKGDSKVFRNGEFIMGVCGSARVKQVLRYRLGTDEFPLPEPGDDLHAYMCTTFVEAARAALEAAGSKASEAGRDSIESSFLVGYKGALFQVYGDFYVQVPLLSYAAMGSGDMPALGALFAMEDAKMVTTPLVRLLRALEAAHEFNAGVRPPFDVVTTAPVLREIPGHFKLTSPYQGVFLMPELPGYNANR